MKRDPTRRALLRLLASAPALVPLLEARQGRAAERSPRRLIILQWTNGVLPDFWPALPAAGQPFAFTDTLKPLERHRRDLTLVGGLKIDYPISTGHRSLPLMLTGTAIEEGGAPLANSASLDQYVAERLSVVSPRPLKSLELAANHVNRADLHRSISFRGPAVARRPADNPPECDPYRVWRRLFGVRGDHLVRLTRQRRSVLDHLGRELAALSRTVGRTDQRQLEAHLESVRHLEKDLPASAPMSMSAGTMCTPGAPAPGLAFRDPSQIDKQVAVLMDLLAMALRCDLVRVATLMLTDGGNNGIAFPFLGSEFQGAPEPESAYDHHGIAHMGGPKKAIVDRWWIEQLASFLDRLRSVVEGDGTMLDSCAVLLANNMADGASHSVAGLPWMIAGGCQGYFRPGQYAAPPGWDPARPTLGCVPHNRILVNLANAMLDGIEDPLSSFGDPSKGGELPGLRV